MGSIYSGGPVVRTARQQAYLSSRKTNRKKVVKHEEQLQLEASEWLRKHLPGVHFHSDTGAGAFNSEYAKDTHNRQQSDKGLPDMTIYAARRGYHGLLIEFKKEGTNLKRKRDGTTIAVIKRNGKVIERDYKVRLKGDWVSLHVERQAKRIRELRDAGYCAVFAVGLQKFKEIVCWYFEMEMPPEENAELEF